jgi:hypothetical protein
LFRLSSDILEGGGDDPGLWRELGAGVAAPMNGFNRLFFGDRYRDRRVRAYGSSGELGLGVSLGGKDDSTGELRDVDAGNVSMFARLVHGPPDDDGWRFRRPFDHFDVATSIFIDRNAFTDRSGLNLLIRGLLVAAEPYGAGTSSGLWGLWGVYDVISTGELRASTSAVGFGTVGQLALSSRWWLQGTAYLGVGFGAAGTNVEVEDERDTTSARRDWARSTSSCSGPTGFASTPPCASTSPTTRSRRTRAVTRTSRTVSSTSPSACSRGTLSVWTSLAPGATRDTRTCPTPGRASGSSRSSTRS